tara:strand:- start:937 stop:1722 length:786 start_codon:yes stop_codon:yes gene_type:complete
MKMKLQNSKSKNLFLSLIIPMVILVIWELSVSSGWIPNTLIASPSQVFVDFFNLLFSGELFTHSFVSLYRLILGFVIGTLIGVFLGIIVGVSKLGEKLISPTIQIIAPIPVIAWIPLFIIFLGIGDASKIALISLAALIIVYINTVQGIRSTDQKLIELADSYKKSRKELITKILIPSALPQILTGMRVALGLSWILLIASEVIASSSGLGWLIWDSRNFSRPDDMIVGMITIGILGKLSDMFLVSIEKKLTKWRRNFKGK